MCTCNFLLFLKTHFFQLYIGTCAKKCDYMVVEFVNHAVILSKKLDTWE